MISSCLALAAALAALRAGDASRLGYFESAPFSFSFSAGSVTLALVACVTAALALRRRQRETAGQDRSVVDSRLWLFAGAALVWGFGRLLAIYELYDDPFGKTSADTTSWIVVGLVTAGLALAYLKLDRVSGFWLLAGLAVLPVVDLVGELLFLGYGDVDPTPSPMLGFWVTFLPVVIMVVTAWRMAVARRPIMA